MGKNRKHITYRKIGSKWINGLVSKSDIPGILQGIGITGVIALLFYRSLWGMLTGFMIVPFWLYQFRQSREKKAMVALRTEFKEYMMLVANALQAGYSLEKAFKQSELEFRKLFEKDSLLYTSLHEMNQKISMNMQVERAFSEMAKGINLEDAINLAEILSFSKRAGGDYGKQIRNCALKIEEKLMVAEEIETIITEKQLELKVMCVMPMGIIGYIALSSKEFIEPLYGNFVGIAIMTTCLLVYGAMIYLGRKIVDIDV